MAILHAFAVCFLGVRLRGINGLRTCDRFI